MKMWVCTVAMVLASFASQAEIESYQELVASISTALQNKELLRGASFTNEVGAFAESTTNELHSVTARLGLSLAFLEISASTMDDDLYVTGFDTVTNALQAPSCPIAAWQRYAAMSIMCDYLNRDSNYEESFAVSTNAIAQIDSCNPNLATPNFWSALTQYDNTPGVSMRESFQANAAGARIMSGNFENLDTFTNGLPRTIMESLLEMMGD